MYVDRPLTSTAGIYASDRMVPHQDTQSLSTFIALDGSQHVAISEVPAQGTSENGATFSLAFLSKGIFLITLDVDEDRRLSQPLPREKFVRARRKLEFVVS